MQSISVFLEITKVTDFRCKIADVSRTQGVCHVNYILFLNLLYVKYDCPKFERCVKGFREKSRKNLS